MYGYLYQKGDKKFTILHALDGYDEISLTGPTKAITNDTEVMLEPTDFGVQAHLQKDIYGGDSISASAKIFLDVISGNGTTPQNNVVCANAGMAIATVKGLTPQQGFEEAKESLLNGKALETVSYTHLTLPTICSV